MTLPMPPEIEPDDEPGTGYNHDTDEPLYRDNDLVTPINPQDPNNHNDEDYDSGMIEPFPMDEDNDYPQPDQDNGNIWDVAESDMLDPDEYYPDDHDDHPTGTVSMPALVDNVDNDNMYTDANMEPDANMDTTVHNAGMDTDAHMGTPVDNADMDASDGNGNDADSGSPGLLERVRGKIGSLIAQARTEIGSDSDDGSGDNGNRPASLSKQGIGDSDDDELDDEPDNGNDSGDDEPSKKKAKRSGKRGNKPKRPSKPSGVKDILLFPFRFIMSAVRAMGKLARILSGFGGVFVILLIIWLVMNIGVARVPMLDNILMPNEGTASVESARYVDGKATIILRNDSGMIAHVSGTANVVTWNPLDNFPSGILKPHTTATCQLPELEMEPDTQQTITASCTGDIRGVWPRVQVKLEYT